MGILLVIITTVEFFSCVQQVIMFFKTTHIYICVYNVHRNYYFSIIRKNLVQKIINCRPTLRAARR